MALQVSQNTFFSRPPSLEEWMNHPPMQLVATSESLDWNDVVLRSMNLNPNLDYYPSPSIANDFLILVLNGSVHMQGHFPDRGLFNEHFIPGSLILAPRNSESYGRWNSASSALFLEIPRKLIIELAVCTAHNDPERIEMRPLINFCDPLLYQLGIALNNELQNASLFGSLYVESLARTAALHLLRNYSNASLIASVPSGQLTAGQVRTVNEYIQAHLHQKISLSDLAECLHLSVSHFERMFRATLHCPPYRYILERRIEKAKILLQEGRLSLPDVGAECGFANQSHFTKHFTRFAGLSPARYAQLMRE